MKTTTHTPDGCEPLVSTREKAAAFGVGAAFVGVALSLLMLLGRATTATTAALAPHGASSASALAPLARAPLARAPLAPAPLAPATSAPARKHPDQAALPPAEVRSAPPGVAANKVPRQSLQAQVAKRGILAFEGFSATAHVFSDEAMIDDDIELALRTASPTPVMAGSMIERVNPRITRGVRIGEPQVALALAKKVHASASVDDEAAVRTTLAQHKGAAQWCFDRALKSDRQAGGKLRVEFTIGANGAVTSAGTSAAGQRHKLGPDVDTCLTSLLKRVAFAPPSGGEVTVAMAFDLRAPKTATAKRLALR